MKPPPFNVYSPKKCDERMDNLILELENENDVVKINKRIAETSGGYFLFTCDTSTMLNEVCLFRVTRPYPDLYSNMEKPKSFSYNPFMSTQRANREGFPVFYGSFSKRTAMEEVDLKPGEEFYISRWNVLPAEIIRTFLLAYDSDERGGVFDEMIEKI